MAALAWQGALDSALKNHEPQVYEEVFEALAQGASSGVPKSDAGLRARVPRGVSQVRGAWRSYVAKTVAVSSRCTSITS